VKPGGIIFEESGQLSPNTYLLLSGSVELRHLKTHGPQVVAILSPGVVFRMPLMNAEVGHIFQWVALDECRVGKLTTERFISITLGIRAADYARVAGVWDNRLSGLLARYPTFVGLRLRCRVAAALLELAHEFGVRDARGVLIRIALTQSQLSGLVGASRAKVGQILIDLERRKAIVRDGRQIAVVVPGLEAIVRSAARSQI
jgi:CRP-like cAMP-binding protein